jgi:hypothetical protein
MAYYSSSYFEDDDLVDQYDQNPYGGSYDSAPAPAPAHVSMPYSSNDSNIHQFFEYNAVPYHGSYSPQSYSSMAYSSYTFSQPRFLEFTQNPAATQFLISYSTVESNVPEFEDYDPTPYGGGYDPAQTYGKPLPPSDEICYPRSTPADPNALGSLALPSGKEETDVGKAAKPSNGISEEEQQQQVGHESYKEEPEPEPYEYDKPVPYPPSGYGLEAMDLCESLFGYWPCLSREKRRCSDGQECGDDEGRSSSSTADYLFGSSYPYGDPNYGPLYRQVDYE